MVEKKVFSLAQISRAVGNAITDATGGKGFWIRSEIAQIRIANSGHAYLELVELHNGNKIASLQGVIWKTQLDIIRTRLGSDFDNIIRNGSEIVFNAAIDFHPVYGLKLHITDIDLSFNLGALEKRKQETLEKLKAEKLIDLNRQVPVPQVIQHIALITSPGSAAYEDFTQHLLTNEHGYRFVVDVFPASVQGESAAASLLMALQKTPFESYHAVAFIRGGGSKLDLDPFNDYELCKAVALCPIPVLSGVGHETDISIIDIVARSPHKTPTAIADFLIDTMLRFETQMLQMFISVGRRSAEIVKVNQLQLLNFDGILKKYPVSYCQKSRGDLHNISTRFVRSISEVITLHKQQLDKGMMAFVNSSKIKLTAEPVRLQQITDLLFERFHNRLHIQIQKIGQLQSVMTMVDPDKTLARGFSITRQGGKALRSIEDIDHEAPLFTTLHDGVIISQAVKIENNEKQTH